MYQNSILFGRYRYYYNYLVVLEYKPNVPILYNLNMNNYNYIMINKKNVFHTLLIKILDIIHYKKTLNNTYCYY